MTELPNELIQNGLFCCWRYEQRQGRRTKVPYQPLTGARAKSNDPGSFVSYCDAIRATGYDGIGIGIFNGVCAIDLDHCISDSGYYSETAAEIVETMHSYTERSPSGEGLHILFQAPGFHYPTDRYYIMNHPVNIEVYVAGATSKYVTVTGEKCQPYDFGDRTEELKQVLEKFMRRPEKPAGNAINAGNSEKSPLPDDRLLQLAAASRNGAVFSELWSGGLGGHTSHSEADLALCSHLAFWTGRDAGQMDALFRRSGLMREKWDRKQSGSTYGAITIQKAIDACHEVYIPKAEASNLFQPVIPLTPQWSELPSFPMQALPPVIRSYVSAVAEHSQTSPDMAAVISLGVLAACLQGKFRVEGTPGYYEPLSLYTVVIASPGERKSSVMRDMTGFLYEYEQEYNQSHSQQLRDNRHQRESLERQISGLQKKLERSQDPESELELQQLRDQLEELPVLKPARFFADDCSSEALTSLMAENHGIFSVISTEGGIFDIMAGRYSGKTNIDIWLKGHCGDSIYVDRMSREPECILHPALTAILSIQPSVLNEIMSNTTMTGRGLIARFLYASPPSRIGSRVFQAPPIGPDITAAYRSLLFHLMALPVPEEPKTVHLSEKAFALMADYFEEHERFLAGEGQAISDWAGKYIGSVLRIAGLLHCAESDEAALSASTLARAIEIGKFFLAHSCYAYSMMGTDISIQKARFVLSKLKKLKANSIKRSELFQMCRGKFFRKTEELFPTLELLESHGFLIQSAPDRHTAGRPADVQLIINPAAF